jgi:hypothetical protein
MMLHIRDNNEKIQEYRLRYAKAIKHTQERYIGVITQRNKR